MSQPRCRLKRKAAGLAYTKSYCAKCGPIIRPGWRCAEESVAPESFVDGGTLMVPETVGQEADRRAREIFDREAAFAKPFNECLGMIYMVGVQAGIAAAHHDAED